MDHEQRIADLEQCLGGFLGVFRIFVRIVAEQPAIDPEIFEESLVNELHAAGYTQQRDDLLEGIAGMFYDEIEARKRRGT